MASVDTKAQPEVVPVALEEQRFLIHGVYEPVSQSEIVPGLDLEVLVRHVRETDQLAALRAFRDWLRSS